MKSLLLASALGALALSGAAAAPGHHGHGAAPAPHAHDAPAQPARTVDIVMREGDGTMEFAPNRIEVRRGEAIRFALRNAGRLEHEFVIGTEAENAEHARMMAAHPDMAHDDPNARRLAPGGSGDLVQRFARPGTFEYACLIPGHLEAGMRGTIVVK